MIKKTLFTLTAIVLLMHLQTNAQNTTISGYVSDSLTGERLIDAGVYDKYSGTGTYTNEYGFFSLSLKSDSAKIVVCYIMGAN